VDDFIGGLCTISNVESRGHNRGWYIEVAERPRFQYNWEPLLRDQDKLKAEYGDRRGHCSPDNSPDSNRWD
jgi:hypothetical protein